MTRIAHLYVPGRRLLLALVIAATGCAAPFEDGSTPGTQGKASADDGLVDSLDGLPGRYVRSTAAAAGEIAGLSFGRRQATGPAGAFVGNLLTQLGCQAGASCEPEASTFAAIPREPRLSTAAIALLLATGDGMYVVRRVERDDAGTITEIDLQKVNDPDAEVPTAFGARFTLVREQQTAPQWVTDVLLIDGLRGTYLRADAPPGALAFMRLAPTAANGWGAFESGLNETTDDGCEPASCGTLVRGSFQAVPSRDGATPAGLGMISADGAFSRYVIEALMRDSSGNVSRVKLARMVDATSQTTGASFEMVRQREVLPALEREITTLAGLGGTFERVGPPPPGELMRIELSALVSADGTFTATRYQPCPEGCLASETGDYHAIPVNAAVGFPFISLKVTGSSEAWSYLIDGIERDETSGEITRLSLTQLPQKPSVAPSDVSPSFLLQRVK